MILQSCIVPDEVCGAAELYYRCSGRLQTDHGCVLLRAGEELSSCTYMNLFDAGAWRKYTTVETLRFRCRTEGRGTIALIHREKAVEKKIKEVSFDSDEEQNGLAVEIELPPEIRSGAVYFTLKADEETRLCEAGFWTDASPDNEISLSLVICTYKRKSCLERNLAKLQSSPALKRLEEEKRFIVRVVDNARELSDSYGKGIRVYPNENTGGSGGFSRGMDESVREKETYRTTHVVLMDDDVELQTESLSRLYALLSHMRPEYARDSVAGRMFRLDRREVQYTAAEIWNGGDLRHIGWNQEMTREENLAGMNDNTGAEYGGWWFACYPMEFVEQNRPLPFFLHCDDVEYGLRHGGTPIILNGIQVWHETYEYRQTPVIAYYDTRNPLIVNALYHWNQSKEEVVENWKKKISFYHAEGDFLSERMAIEGMLDYIRDGTEIEGRDPAENHLRIARKKHFVRLTNMFLWRMTKTLYELTYKRGR